jgi:hypothetical protein
VTRCAPRSTPEIFFPEKSGSTKDAKGICARCEVRADCLEYALNRREHYGIWGATSSRERERIARQRGIRWDDDETDYRPWDHEYPEIAS